MDDGALTRAIDRQVDLIARHLAGTGLGLRIERSATTASCYVEVSAEMPTAADRRDAPPPLRLRLSDHAPTRDDAVALDARDPAAWIEGVETACARFGIPVPPATRRARRFLDRD